MPKGLFSALALVALVVSLPALAVDRAAGSGAGSSASAITQLLRMTTAMRNLDYQGSFVYQHADRTDALRIFHAGGSPERERLISLTGPRNEVVRDGNTVTCIQSGAPPTVFTNSTGSLPIPGFARAIPDAIAADYTLSLDGEDRVAGYATRRLRVTPRDVFRYGYRLWIERDSDLLLRSIVVDADDRPLEEFMFVTVQIGAKPAPGDLLPEKTGKAVAPSDEVALEGPQQWQVTHLPAGFRLVSSRRPARATNGAEHLMYSDGLANVSLYVEPLGTAPTAEPDRLSRGALQMYSEDRGDWRFTALGNVPAATVERLVKSTTPAGRANSDANR